MHEREKWKWSHSVAQSYPTLGDPMDCSLPGSSVHAIFQARVLEWSAIAFSDIYVKGYLKRIESGLFYKFIMHSSYIFSLESSLFQQWNKNNPHNMQIITDWKLMCYKFIYTNFSVVRWNHHYIIKFKTLYETVNIALIWY